MNAKGIGVTASHRCPLDLGMFFLPLPPAELLSRLGRVLHFADHVSVHFALIETPSWTWFSRPLWYSACSRWGKVPLNLELKCAVGDFGMKGDTIKLAEKFLIPWEIWQIQLDLLLSCFAKQNHSLTKFLAFKFSLYLALNYSVSKINLRKLCPLPFSFSSHVENWSIIRLRQMKWKSQGLR